jgi:hypothetical protein
VKKKIESALKIIEMVSREYRSPIIYSGMGKDSLPLIHLCHKHGFKWDVMFHRDPYFPSKYRYANRIIDEWGLVCRDYPARGCSVFYFNGVFEVVRHFQCGIQDMVLCAMLYKPKRFKKGEYLCALKDIYEQPKGNLFGFVWDVGLMSHRYTERKPHGAMAQNGLLWTAKHNIGTCDFIYPLFDWTDEDMYRYFVDNNIPINYDVYDVKDNTLVPKIDPKTCEIDSTYNPDRRPACFECMLPVEMTGQTVFCPKKGCTVNNVWENVEKVMMPTDFPLTVPPIMYPDMEGSKDG